MKLKDLLKTVSQLVGQLNKALLEVSFCEDCRGESQEKHVKKHLNEARKIRDKLPHGLKWELKFDKLRIKPSIAPEIDKEGRIVVKLVEVDVT